MDCNQVLNRSEIDREQNKIFMSFSHPIMISYDIH